MFGTKKKQTFLEELREISELRSKEWGSGLELDVFAETLFRSNEMGGECGELQNEVKKWARGMLNMEGGEDNLEAISEEIGDVLICLDRVASMFGISLEEATRDKFNKTSDKYDFDERL